MKFRTVNGVENNGSAKQYNKGFVKAFKVFKKLELKAEETFKELDKLINDPTACEMFKYGVNDASRIIAQTIARSV